MRGAHPARAAAAAAAAQHCGAGWAGQPAASSGVCPQHCLPLQGWHRAASACAAGPAARPLPRRQHQPIDSVVFKPKPRCSCSMLKGSHRREAYNAATWLGCCSGMLQDAARSWPCRCSFGRAQARGDEAAAAAVVRAVSGCQKGAAAGMRPGLEATGALAGRRFALRLLPQRRRCARPRLPGCPEVPATRPFTASLLQSCFGSWPTHPAPLRCYAVNHPFSTAGTAIDCPAAAPCGRWRMCGGELGQ